MVKMDRRTEAAPGMFGGNLFMQLGDGAGCAGTSGDLLELGVELRQIVITEIFQTDVVQVSALGGAQQFVELDLDGLTVAVLGVLNEEDHQEGDDCSAGIDDQLPRVRVMEKRTSQSPDENDEDGAKENAGGAGPGGHAARDDTETIFHSFHHTAYDKNAIGT